MTWCSSFRTFERFCSRDWHPEHSRNSFPINDLSLLVDADHGVQRLLENLGEMMFSVLQGSLHFPNSTLRPIEKDKGHEDAGADAAYDVKSLLRFGGKRWAEIGFEGHPRRETEDDQGNGDAG